MSVLHDALGDISRIRRQMAGSTQFRGYGPATLAGTGVAAIVVASVQARWIASPALHLHAYLALWIGTAVVSSSVAAVQVMTRTRRLHPHLSDEMIRGAIEQFLPAVIAGLLVTSVLLHFAPTLSFLLPGLWQIFYCLGVFASCRSLPRAMYAAGAWYLVTGLACLSFADARAFAPWTMGLAFGAGQLLIATVLWTDAGQAGELPGVDDEV